MRSGVMQHRITLLLSEISAGLKGADRRAEERVSKLQVHPDTTVSTQACSEALTFRGHLRTSSGSTE